MAKYSAKLVEKIVKLIEEDQFSISTICELLRISTSTFYRWRATIEEFASELDRAEERRDDELIGIARRSLRKKLEGYTTVETKTKYIPSDDGLGVVMKEQVVKEKYCAPDTRAIMWVLGEGKGKSAAKKKVETNRPYKPIVVHVPDEECKRQIELLMSRGGKPGNYQPVLPVRSEGRGEGIR